MRDWDGESQQGGPVTSGRRELTAPEFSACTTCPSTLKLLLMAELSAILDASFPVNCSQKSVYATQGAKDEYLVVLRPRQIDEIDLPFAHRRPLTVFSDAPDIECEDCVRARGGAVEESGTNGTACGSCTAGD